MMAWPESFDCLMIRMTRSNSFLYSDSLKAHSVTSTVILRTRASRSSPWIVPPETCVMYSGTSSVRMMPLSPLTRQYLMWLSVE